MGVGGKVTLNSGGSKFIFKTKGFKMAKLNTKLFCTYCGLPAQCLDHVIPVSHTEKKRKRDYTMGNAVDVVPACNDLK